MSTAAKELIIKINGDNSAWRRAIDSSIEAAKKIDAAAKRTADVQSREAKTSADVQVREAKRAADAHEMGFGVASAAGEKFRVVLSSVAGQFGLMSVGERVLTSLAAASAEATRRQSEYAQSLFKTKEELKEIAALRGLAFADDKFVKEMANFSRSTGLTISESDQFQRQVYGSAEAGLQKGNIDKETLDKLTVRAGSVAARQTKDYGTRGDLIGVLSQFRKYDKGETGVRQALSDAERIRLGLTEGRGDDAPLTKSLLSVAGSLAGEGKMVGTLPEMAAVIGAMSLSAGPGQADTRTEQLVRGLRGETPKQTAFMKSFAGIGENDNMETRLDKIVPKLREMKSKGRDISAFLTENGVNAEQTRAIAEAESNYEVIKGRMSKARMGADGVDEANRKFDQSPLGQMRKADAAVEAAKLDQGTKTQLFEVAKKEAEAKLVASGQTKSDWYGLGNALYSATTLGTRSGEEMRIEQMALRDMRIKAGFNPSRSPYQFSGVNEEAAFLQETIDANNKQYQESNAFKNSTNPLERIMKQQNEILIRGLGVGLAPAMIPAGPAPPMKRPGE